MIFLTLGLVAIACAVSVKLADWRDWSYFPFMIGWLATAALLVAIIISIATQVSFPAEYAGIEQLKIAARNIDIKAAESIAGRVADTNGLIVTNRWYNTQWWADPFVSDHWDTVSTVELPK